MQDRTNTLNNWASIAYSLLKKTLTVEDREVLYDLFEQADECTSLSYRKLRILALLRCGFSSDHVVDYLLETAQLSPYKPMIYNHFFALAQSDAIEFIFRQIVPGMRTFVWTDPALKRIIGILNPTISTVITNQGKYECSHCRNTIPKIVHFEWKQILHLWVGNKIDTVLAWLNEVSTSSKAYTVVVDGANVGRFLRTSTSMGAISSKDIDGVTQFLLNQGEVPCIVLSEIHKNTYTGSTDNIVWSPRLINDDICWMILTMMKPGCTFVSNDKCTDWEYILDYNIKDTDTLQISNDFKIWFDAYRRKMYYIRKEIHIGWSRGYTKHYFTSNNHHHLPINNSEDTWLCWK